LADAEERKDADGDELVNADVAGRGGQGAAEPETGDQQEGYGERDGQSDGVGADDDDGAVEEPDHRSEQQVLGEAYAAVKTAQALGALLQEVFGAFAEAFGDRQASEDAFPKRLEQREEA